SVSSSPAAIRPATASVGLVSPRSTCESIGAETPERSARSRSESPMDSRSARTRAPTVPFSVAAAVTACTLSRTFVQLGPGRRRLAGGLGGRRLGLADGGALERVRERPHVGPRRGLEDVGGDALSARQAPVGTQHDADLPERVLALGHRRDGVLAELRVRPGRLADGAEDRVHGAVAGGVADLRLAGGQPHRDPRARVAARARLDLEPLERVAVLAHPHLVGDDRLEIERRDRLLLVGDLLEAAERLVEGLPVDLEAELLERVAKRVAPGVLAEHDLVGLEADVAGVHDLVGAALLEHPVLVDAGLVREGVTAHDRLVRLHWVAGEARDEAARPRQLARVERRVEPVRVAAGPQQHHDLLELAVPGPLPDPVDRALDLA